MITSKLTGNRQTTILQAVRKALGLRSGDSIAYQIEDGRVVLTRSISNVKTDDPRGTFSEWDNPNDEKAYSRL